MELSDDQIKLECEWIRYDAVNYAMQQNDVPIVRSIRIRSLGPVELRLVKLTIKTEPEFAEEWSRTIDLIPAEGLLDLGAAPIRLSGSYLASLTERVRGTLKLEISQDGRILHEESSPIVVLAYDEWAGLAAMPDMIGGFVLPNHPVVAGIIREAAPLLEKWTGSPSFDAYQSRNPNRVRHQAAAIFAAIQARGITYAVAPASFEAIGQRVRLPDAVTQQGLGNCLDLTVLYAACLEAVGLHPLAVFTEGHAFPGVWLVEETFAESIQDDLSLLTKRMAAGVHEISVAEATLMTAGGCASFEEAEAAALTHLGKPDAFELFVDIRRTRFSGIRPLPVRVHGPTGWEIVEEPQGRTATAHAEAPTEMAIQVAPGEATFISVTKQKQWERKLLDLTLRNTLLNFRMTKSALPLLHDRLGELEDSLAEGKEFQLLPRPLDWEGTARSAELFQSVRQDDPLAALIRQEFQQKRLRADAGDRELADKAVHLYRSARLSLEENGANTLYLALGLLKWYESSASDQPRYAPIVLVPVELVRKTSAAGIVLRSRDEETQINITLLEMMRQDFGIEISGLDPLPRDERGIDLAGVFAAIRRVILNLSRWDVEESAMVGLFSFSRFVMWNDIRSRAEDLARSPVVASLMAGRLQWEPGVTFPASNRLDELQAPDQLLLPISSDSTQLTAIAAAQGGKSFVLHGPPGTGKSQTITNMIASSLAEGRTVLFVAEKMAALSVVQSRLEAIGLGPYALELHSNKSTKKAVLDQLRQTLERARAASPEDWQRQADRLAASRSELGGYVASLHRKYGFGASLSEAISRFGELRGASESVRLEPSVVGGMTQDGYEDWQDLARQLVAAGRAAGHPHGHVWRDATGTAYSPALRAEAGHLVAAIRQTLASLPDSWAALTELAGLDASDLEPGKLARAAAVLELLKDMPIELPQGLLGVPELDAARAEVERAIRHGRARDEIRARLAARFSLELLASDAAGTLAEWRQAERKWFLPRLLQQNRLLKAVRRYSLPGTVLGKPDVEAVLSDTVRCQTESEALKQSEPAASALLGRQWNGGEAAWDSVEATLTWVVRLQETLSQLHLELDRAYHARRSLAGTLASGREAFLQSRGPAISDLLQLVKELGRLEGQLSERLGIDFAAMDGARGDGDWTRFRMDRAEAWQQHLDNLREWCSWRQVRGRAIESGLEALATAYETGRLRHEEVIPAFERAWWTAAIAHILESDPQLGSFSGQLFEEKIKTFQATMDTYESLTRQEIAARLASRIPPMEAQAASSSEAGILLRAIRSGGRGLSLRSLFERIPNLLSRICPCMLMSPMSVAQYLDPGHAPFDLVLFDEASQLPTSEAVGAMARGRSVIVVGDPKQLPPTSFFTSTASGEETDEAAVPDDLESILDDCLALGMPQEHLLWHYRSRHESLIAFSNRHFYESKLLTFPSPYERKSSVVWHPVEGMYDRGRTKQNRAEAEQVIAEIARRLRDPQLCRHSIGVVTFSSIQQTLIEDRLDEMFRLDSSLELAASRLHEPIFIKNLENVQGDERDVILFSIGYGPDASGKVALNFGPLNRDGGWRRLNVAVSRARREMHVFSSLRADQLDASRTRAQGVSALRAFLDYAEKGASALGMQSDLLAGGELGIESQIAAGLERKGYRVDLRVGTSGYRIDLAIVHPDDPDRYLLAVLCDGETYRTGKTARDREVLRTEMLRQLGWSLHRVWAMDWLHSPEREVERIIQTAEAALESERRAHSAKVASASEEDAARRELEEARDQSAAAIELAAGGKGIKSQGSIPGNGASLESAFDGELTSPPVLSADSAASRSPKSTYRAVVLEPVSLPSEGVFQAANSELVKAQLTAVIQGEGPVSRSLLGRRVMQAWGISRAGARIERHLDSMLAELDIRSTEHDGVRFYWPDHADPDVYEDCRLPAADSDRRGSEDLPPQEIAGAIREVLFAQGSLPVEDLIRETVKRLGYARTGTALDRAVRSGLQLAVERETAVVRDGRAAFRSKT
ncbi:hypothetical protein VE23_12475 [Paenibacillus sp. D9]|nr:hypothetical protein VE23_12475 [Paenibacillus sp. D9]